MTNRKPVYAKGPMGRERSYRPDKPCLIYDGHCGICAGNLPWLYRLDPQAKFSAIPYQDSDLQTFFPHLSPELCAESLYLVFPDRTTYAGPDAFREFFLRLPRSFLIGLFISIPPIPQLLRCLYPFIARNRYRIGGRCEISGDSGLEPD